ncbi:hypothetical protein NQU17_11550 [Clostridiaceae bacterium HFYG-1003]|nr:hypothetical protein NQU17_11550 [Clostridiaceae bacterium HFYG-1003]
MLIQKSKKIVLVSHCILNQNTVVNGLERAAGPFPLAHLLIDHGIGILQLPCPEFFQHNLDRPGMEYEEYNTAEYRSLSARLLEPILWQVEQYLQRNYQILGLIGIQESPSCSLSGQTGVFMQVLLNMLKERGIELDLFEISPDYGIDPTEDQNLHQRFLEFINKE